MKKILIVFLLFISVIANATKYYVATTGNNGNPGTIGSPWLTVAYACGEATLAGDTIHVNAGSYSMSAEILVSPGVTIEGDGITTIFSSTYSVADESHALLKLSSSAGTSGNQTIRNIKFDGNNWTASIAILVAGRTNVKIHDCTFYRFNYGAITLFSSFVSGLPSTFATGNQIYNNIITDCSTRSKPSSMAATGSIILKGQQTLTINHNRFVQTGRAAGSNGNIITGVSSYNKDVTIYDNYFEKPVDEDGSWNFAIEIWQSLGGINIYNNEFNGADCAVDISGFNHTTNLKGAYDYSYWIHDNYIYFPSQYPTSDLNDRQSICLEGWNIEDVIIERNRFRNITKAINFTSNYGSTVCTWDRIDIRYNIFENEGFANDAFTAPIYITSRYQYITYNRINIYNNTLRAGTTGTAPVGIFVWCQGDINRLYIKNNIVQGFSSAWLEVRTNTTHEGTLDSLDIQYNLLYNNGGSNAAITTSTGRTNYVYLNNSIGDPLLTGENDFHLLSGSPASNAGYDLDLTLDYDSVAVHATTPEKGAYEIVAGGGIVIPTVTTTAITAITSTTATSGGNVSSAGGGTVSARGICWNTSTNPTILNNLTSNGTGTGSYTSSLTGLSPGITYYVRAYATNEAGTAYGSNVSFTTTGTTSNIYFVSPIGYNGGAGTISDPWLTLQYAFNAISAGDTLYVRGGEYSPTATTGSGSGGTIYAGVYVTGKDGTAGNMYTVLNFPEETPILDGENIANVGHRAGILLNGCNYWHIKGITIRNVAQYSSGAYSSQGIQINSGNNNLIENCVAYSNGGPGFRLRTPDGHDNTFLNCDAYYNYDPYSSSDGEDADGFDIGFISSDRRVRLTGCRAWDNGDDGFDMYQGTGYTGIFYLTNCWAWRNGYIPGTRTSAGNGCGFKYGDDGLNNYSITRRYSYNCIAYDNRTRGYSQESAMVKKVFFNCIAYKNNTHGFSFWGLDVADTLRNNVSWGNVSSNIEQLGTTRVSDHNSWDVSMGVTASSVDYTSIIDSELDDARDADGNLPVMLFLHLVTSSDLVTKGIAISGLTLDGDRETYFDPPSLGPFELLGKEVGEETLPIVTTAAITDRTATSATSGGNVTDDGGATVTQRGIVWATTTGPTVTSYLGMHINGGGEGIYTGSLTGLTGGTKYYVRAFATNSVGTSYGAELTYRPAGRKIVMY
jgi:parallel beta-helix repeat protein